MRRHVEAAPDWDGSNSGVGFSMSFLRIHNEQVVDGDREQARRFLDERGLRLDTLHESSAHLMDADGTELSFDGYWTDLHLDPLDSSGTFGGGIWHATLTREECQFVFDLCVACGLLMCNHQGGTRESPMFVVPWRTHRVEDVAELDSQGSYRLVDTADELRAALSGGFERFVAYRNRVLGADAD
jgi:hypothetical protein